MKLRAADIVIVKHTKQNGENFYKSSPFFVKLSKSSPKNFLIQLKINGVALDGFNMLLKKGERIPIFCFNMSFAEQKRFQLNFFEKPNPTTTNPSKIPKKTPIFPIYKAPRQRIVKSFLLPEKKSKLQTFFDHRAANKIKRNKFFQQNAENTDILPPNDILKFFIENTTLNPKLENILSYEIVGEVFDLNNNNNEENEEEKPKNPNLDTKRLTPTEQSSFSSYSSPNFSTFSSLDAISSSSSSVTPPPSNKKFPKFVDCSLFLWNKNDLIVVSDVDGTITKSDTFGVVFPLLGKDYTHPNIALLYSEMSRKLNFRFLYLTARPLAQKESTRNYLQRIIQPKPTNGLQNAFSDPANEASSSKTSCMMPGGPIFTNTEDIISSFLTGVIYKRPDSFKVNCLNMIRSLFCDENDEILNMNIVETGKDEDIPVKIDENCEIPEFLEDATRNAGEGLVMKKDFGEFLDLVFDSSSEQTLETTNSTFKPENRDKEIASISKIVKEHQETASNPNNNLQKPVSEPIPNSTPFVCGFGNQETDCVSYFHAGIPKEFIFRINPKGQIKRKFLRNMKPSHEIQKDVEEDEEGEETLSYLELYNRLDEFFAKNPQPEK